MTMNLGKVSNCWEYFMVGSSMPSSDSHVGTHTHHPIKHAPLDQFAFASGWSTG
ncbi:MAG: hypothetical protein JWP34_4587, partial [Massilia sp.]|nr:hypothetical protein [Massilia sp.]